MPSSNLSATMPLTSAVYSGVFQIDGDMGLRPEIVDLIRLSLAQDLDQVRGIAQITVVQLHLGVRLVRVLIDVINALGVEQRGAALDHEVLSKFSKDMCWDEGRFGTSSIVFLGLSQWSPICHKDHRIAGLSVNFKIIMI